MPVLTNNYTVPDPILPLLAKARYITEESEPTSNIVIGGGRLIELNTRIHKLLDEYSLLEDNWDDDNALAPDNKVIQRAKNLTILLERFSQRIFHCAPGPNGEIMLDIRNDMKNRSIEIILYSGYSIVVFFPQHGKPHQEPFNIDNLPEYLTWLHQK